MTIKYRKMIWAVLPVCLLVPRLAQAQERADLPGWGKRDSIVTTLLTDDPAWKVTSAISTVKGERLEKSFTQNVMNTLYGQLPGLTVMQGSGEPGADSPTIIARGFNTLSTTDRSVLVIIDGFESSLDKVSVQEIESVSLLKDAAAAVLYGMRGANGVLLVTTKRGAVQPLEVNFSAQLGFNTPIRMPKYLDSYNYATLYDEARRNDGLSPVYEGTDAMEAYRTGSNPYLYPNVDWYDEVLKKSSVLQNYTLNLRGGNDVVKYFALVNVSDNSGLFKGTDPKQKESANTSLTSYNVRANVDVNVTKELEAQLKLAANVRDQIGPTGGAWGVFNRLSLLPPNAFPVYNPNGTYGGNGAFSNPVGDLKEKGYNSYNARSIQSSLRLRYKLDALLKGLSISAAYSFNNSFSSVYNKTRNYPYSSVAMSGDEYVYNVYNEKTSFVVDDGSSTQWRNTIYQGTIDYSNLFNSVHSIDANVAFFSDVTYDQYDSDVKDSQYPHKYVGLRGRVSYAYDQRYIAEVAFGYEGSDLYARGKRFGLFPALSLGWILSNEAFLKESDAVNFLKLRTSYGLTGNTSVVGKRYAFEQDYAYTGSYYFGTNNTQFYGIREDVMADVNRTWEKEKRFNIGVDATLFNMFDVTFDYFKHDRYDILVSPAGTIPGFSGLRYAEMNLGKSTNSGFETSVRFGKKIGKLEYYAQANFWYAKDKLTYMAEEALQWPYKAKTGQRLNQPFGLVAEGLFRDEAEIAASPVQTFGEVKPGDIKYKDMNGDRQIDGEDTCPIGRTGTPDFSGSLTLGFKYRGFDFETMIYGVGNRTTYLSGSTYWAFQNQYAAPESALARWTEATKESAVYPRLSTRANNNNTQYSSFWQADGSFLKLRYVEMGYTLPQQWSKAVYTKNIRVFLNGTNLFSLNRLGGLKNADPEGLGGYPSMRTVSVGVKLQFGAM